MYKTTSYRLVNISIVCISLLFFGLLFWLTPSPNDIGTHRQLIPVPCPFNVILSLPCPSCGMTTSLSFLAHGDILSSLRSHPVGPVVFIFVLAIMIFAISGAITSNPWWKICEKRWFQNVLLCAISLYIVVWLFRLFV